MWDKLKKPIICLAPMADVTDSAFRFIIAKYSKPANYVTYTEFVSADGICLAPEAGRKKLMKDLEYSEIERPIVAQFFTSKPEMMERVAHFAVELGFDGVDINMGCPDKSVEKQGAGAALIKNPALARELIRAAKKGTGGKIPVSVKTRLGYNKDELEQWLPELLAEEPAAIIIHARTRKEMSKVPARWERIKRAVEIRNQIQHPKNATQKVLASPLFGRSDIFSGHFSDAEESRSDILSENFSYPTLIIGNGDVEDPDEGRMKVRETGCDGVMLGRAIFGNPYLFTDYKPSWKERLETMLEHTKLFDEKLGGVKSFAVMKKHYKAYLNKMTDFEDRPAGAGRHKLNELKDKLMIADNLEAVDREVKKFFLENNIV